MHVAILAKSSERTPKAEVDRAVDAVRSLQSFLEEHGHSVVVDARTADIGGFTPSASMEGLPEGADLRQASRMANGRMIELAGRQAAE